MLINTGQCVYYNETMILSQTTALFGNYLFPNTSGEISMVMNWPEPLSHEHVDHYLMTENDSSSRKILPQKEKNKKIICAIFQRPGSHTKKVLFSFSGRDITSPIGFPVN